MSNFSLRIVQLIVVAIGVFFALWNYASVTADDSQVSGWVSPLPTVEEVQAEQYDASQAATYCRHPGQSSMSITVDGMGTGQACVTGGAGDFRVGTYNIHTPVVSFPGDSKFYRIRQDVCQTTYPYCIYIPQKDMLAVKERVGGEYIANRLVIYKNVKQRLTRVVSDPISTAYDFDNTNPDFVMQGHDGRYPRVNFIGASGDGNTVLAARVDGGMFTVDTDTFKVRRFSSDRSYQNQDIQYDVSDDGRFVAIMGHTVSPAIYELDPECGVILPNVPSIDDYDNWRGDCPTLWLMGNQQLAIDRLKSAHAPKFSHDSGELRYYARSHDNSGSVGRWVTLRAANYTPSRLDYLALGDSYSSGEGDTEKNKATGTKYYRSYTNNEERQSANQPREKCHVSTRSYPYKLAASMGLGLPKTDSTTKWQSVACSGAKLYDANKVNLDGYQGQFKGKGDTYYGRLHGYDTESLQAIALNEFIPGRAKQIEFVEKYKPKVITLTMGGNDLGFADIIKKCLQNTPCDITTVQGKRKLGEDIKSKFKEFKEYYELLKDKSGGAKIYVLGYTQVVSGDAGDNIYCPAGIGALVDSERRIITEGYKYANQIISTAASSAAVKYIDVEDALEGYRLCKSPLGDAKATGVAVLWDSERQETFHPNAEGHAAIANKVWEEVDHQDLRTYSGYPTESIETNMPESDILETATGPDVKSRHVDMTQTEASKGDNIFARIREYMMAPGEQVSITLFSDPVHLGTFTVSEMGSLDVEISIPTDIPAGYHTLVVSGQTYSGEPIEYEQTVLIKGSNPEDIDDDGVLDAEQPCGPFMTASSQDTDLDGIDDACDPEISEGPELYRLRQGDMERTYAGQPERAHYLYVERNTRASSLTGIAADEYDPAANFEVTGGGTTTSPHRPYAYLRGGGWGCVSFTPTKLTKVTAGQEAIRTLKKVTINTDKCRQELSDDDVDGNGQADDSQPLYQAKNGDSTRDEDPNRIYLYRSYHAAEAQLGLSDYTPTGTAANTIAVLPLIPNITTPPNDPLFGRSLEPIQDWNLLSVSKANVYIPQFNRLAVLDTSHPDNSTGVSLPIILTQKQNNQCIAYKPQNTSIIKFNQQNTLIKMASVPEGESCE